MLQEMGSINKELERAVSERNLCEVQALLSKGANVHVRTNGETLLHRAGTVEIARELLSFGANVHARNAYKETPLHAAITLGKELEIVRELLKHGADVNALTIRGNTPLNHAVTRSSNHQGVIEELLKYGADINIKNCDRRKPKPSSSLDNAVHILPRAKLLIKYTLVNNFNEDYTKIIDLNSYKEHQNYSELSSYLVDCVCELLKMKEKDISLYEITINKLHINKPCNNKLSMKLSKSDQFVHYPIYADIISDKIKPFLEKARLLDILSKLHVYTESDISDHDIKVGKVFLDNDSVYNIAEYLSNNDINNLLLAFYSSSEYIYKTADPVNNVIELSEQPNIEPNKKNSPSNCTKRARLE